MAGEQIPESWVGQRVAIWARAEGQPFEDSHGRIVAGYDQAMGEFSGRLEGVNDLGATLAVEDNFFMRLRPGSLFKVLRRLRRLLPTTSEQVPIGLFRRI
jgi:hypothetical protein